MADRNMVSPIAPLDSFPERVGTTYERKRAPDVAGGTGPGRFYEGLATDTDLPNEFSNGAMQGYITAPGRNNHNENVYEKWPEETMRERAHLGSASWTEAPTYLGEFAHGTDSVLAERKYEQIDRSAPYGRRYERHNPAEVMD
jgi:hypothetical protein